MMRISALSIGMTVCLSLVIGGARCAYAQETPSNSSPDTANSGGRLQEVIVTAQKREQRAQDIGATIDAISSKDLEADSILQSTDITKQLTNVTVSPQIAGGMPMFSIRGVSSEAAQYSNDSSPVAVNVDGTYMSSNALAAFALFDLERVEVLKGPQGTLFGKNTTGGVVNYISTPATNQLSGYVDISRQRFHELRTVAAINIPITDKLRVRLSGMHDGGDGYLFNRLTNAPDGGPDISDGRAIVNADITPNWNLNFNVHGGVDRSYAQPYAQAGLDGAGCYSVGKGDLPPVSCVDDFGYSDTVRNPYAGSWTLSDRMNNRTLGSVTELQGDIDGAKLVALASYDWLSRYVPDNESASPLPTVNEIWDEQLNQSSEEVRLSSPEQSTVFWLVGVYHDQSHLDMGRSVPDFSEALDIDYDSISREHSEALFGDLEVPITEKLHLVTGVRYTWEYTYMAVDNEFYAPPGSGQLLEQLCTPSTCGGNTTAAEPSGKLGVEYHLSHDDLLYASYNRGFKSGGFPGGITTNPQTFVPYKPEYVDAWEVGAKTLSLDDSLLMNVSTFYYNYKDKQEYTILPGSTPTNVLQVYSNAAGGRAYGAEFETKYRVSHFTFSGGLGLLRTKYTDYVVPADLIGSPEAASLDLTGHEFAISPHTSLNGSIDYTAAAGRWGIFIPRISYRYQSSMWWNSLNENNQAEKAYGVADARLDWEPSWLRLTLSVYALNLFNTVYRVNVGTSPIDSLLMNYGPPRVWGIEGRYDF